MSGADGRGGRGLPHGVQATKEVLRDFRESSVNSRSSTGSASGVGMDNTAINNSQDAEFYDVDAVAAATRDQKSPERYPSPYNNRQHHHGSMSSLGVSLVSYSIFQPYNILILYMNYTTTILTPFPSFLVSY